MCRLSGVVWSTFLLSLNKVRDRVENGLAPTSILRCWDWIGCLCFEVEEKLVKRVLPKIQLMKSKKKFIVRATAVIATVGMLVSGASLAVADTGLPGGGSEDGGGGDGSKTARIEWVAQDSFGVGNPDAELAAAFSAMGVTNENNTLARSALDKANSECETRYTQVTGNPRSQAGCRLFALGAIITSDNAFWGQGSGFTQQQWFNAWSSVTLGREYVYKGSKYSTATVFGDGSTSLDAIAARETASVPTVVAIVLANNEPKGEVPPAPPSKSITKGVSADSMVNTTTITSKTGVGGTKMVFKDTITPNGVDYKVSNQKVVDTTTGEDVSSKFTFAHTGNEATSTWKGGDLPEDHEFKWSLDITVSLPDVNRVADKASVKWNDEPEQSTDEHEFPTWSPKPDKSWVRLDEKGVAESVIDPDWSNSTGADNAVLLDGDRIGAVVNVPIAANLAQAPKSLVITDDFTAADYLVDLADMSDAKIYFSDATKDTVSSVTDIVKTGTDITAHFAFGVEGMAPAATADDEFLASLKGRAKPSQVTVVFPAVVNFANGEGAAKVREDAGVEPGSELEFCGVPSDSDQDGSETQFLNAGSAKINNDLKNTNTPKICGYIPPVEKDVLAEASQGGGQESVDSKKVMPGQTVEYKLMTTPKLPENLAYDVTAVSQTDQFDEYVTPSKQTLEVTDLSTGDMVPKSEYSTQWDDAAHRFTITYSDEFVATHFKAGQNPRLILRFEARVNDDAPVTETLDNEWTLKLNNSVTPSNKVVNLPVDPKPSKQDTQKDASINIDGMTAMLGDKIYYRLHLDASDLADSAYKIQRLGMIDDYDEEYLKLDSMTVVDESGTEVTDKFNLQNTDGQFAGFAKTVDTKIPATGETVKGDPQPTDLFEYATKDLDPLTDPSIDQALLGQDYDFILEMTVIKVTDDYVVENQATQVTNDQEKVTNVVTNPLKEINPRKDVLVKVGGESADGKSIYLNHQFLYQLDSSVLPPNRAYPIVTSWNIRDDYDESHDRFTGQWAVYASRDVLGTDGSILAAKGTKLAGSVEGEHQSWFTFTQKDGVFSIEATAEYLAIVSANNSAEQAWTGFVQMERVATGEVENSFDETMNDVIRHSNVVKTQTADETPSIDLEKYDETSGLKLGDRDTPEQALQGMKNGDVIAFTMTNTGQLPLGHLNLTDKTIAGVGEVTDIQYPKDWDTLILAPGEKVTVKGTFTGVEPGSHHTDRATVTAKPKIECPVVDEDPFDDVEPEIDPNAVCWDTPVMDTDDWNGVAPTPLAQTGTDMMGAGVAAVILAGLGVALSAVGKRRSGAHVARR